MEQADSVWCGVINEPCLYKCLGIIEIMEYLVQIIEALVWPLTTLILFFALRKPIVEIFPQLTKLKFKELEMEFEKELKEISEKSRESKVRIEADVPRDEEEEHYLEEIKRTSPRAAILESWLGLESQVLSTTEYFGLLSKNQRPSFSASLKALEKAEVIAKGDIELINGLRKLRNLAVHQTNFTVTEDEAELFIEAARNQVDMIVGKSWQKLG